MPYHARLALGLGLALLSGCSVGPLVDNPVHVNGLSGPDAPNPLLVAPGEPGPEAYASVFERVVDILDDYFEIADKNRYDGRIETYPRIAPGYEQIWKPSSPDPYERLYATLQSLRHRASVQISPAPEGGYYVRVSVFRELEDLPRPSTAVSAPAFRDANILQRQYDIVDPIVVTQGWIPKGQDEAFEQKILRRIQGRP
jgi:hypothetical protein